MPTILDVNFGREFFGWPETLEKQGRKIRHLNSPSKFAENFVGNFPKIRRTKIKIHPNSALHDVGTNILGLKKARDFWGRCKNRRRSRRESRDFGALSFGLARSLERPCGSQEGASMLLRRQGGFLIREGGFLRRFIFVRRRRGGPLLKKGGGIFKRGGRVLKNPVEAPHEFDTPRRPSVSPRTSLKINVCFLVLGRSGHQALSGTFRTILREQNQALSAILREQNQAFSGTFREQNQHFQAFSGA